MVLLLDADTFRVRHATSNCAAVIDGNAIDPVGATLEELFEEAPAELIRERLAHGAGDLGWQRVRLRSGHHAKVHGFDPGPGLHGLDVIPQAPGAQSYGAQAVERVAQWSERLLATSTIDDLLRFASETVNELTGFEGTWACRSEPNGTGFIVANATDGTADLTGQWALAIDLPAEQPEVRGRAVPFYVADVDDEHTGLEPALTGPLDAAGSTLQRINEPYLERLRELGARASLSVPIVVDGVLWGRLIAAHPQPVHIPPAVQAELRILSATTSAHLSELLALRDTRDRLDHAIWSGRILESIAGVGDLLEGLVADSQALLGLCSANSALVAIEGREVVVGEPLDDDARGRLLDLARQQLDREVVSPVISTDAVATFAPEATLAVAAGFLAVRLGTDGRNLIVWTRPENRASLTWVDHQPADGDDSEHLFPEVSGRVQEQRGTSVPWSPAQVQAVTDFHAALASLIMARYQQVAQLNAQLERSNDEFDAFSHAAAHDLKQPIRSIQQYTEFFLEDVAHKLDDDEQEQLTTVLRLTGRMTGMLDDLMRYAELGESALQPQEINLREAVGRVTELLPPSAVDGASITATDEPITADPAALQQLLLNLIDNAIKFSGDAPPHVTVGMTTLQVAGTAAPPPNTLIDVSRAAPVLFVADRGRGIELQHQARVFDLFRKLGDPSTGSGAGLAICRRLARRHGGDIWLSSEPGSGATFYVVLAP